MKVVLSVLALSFTGSFASMAMAPVHSSATAVSNTKSTSSRMALKAKVLLTENDLLGESGRQSSARSASTRRLEGEDGKSALTGEGGRTSLIGTNGKSALIGEAGKSALIGEAGKQSIGEAGRTLLIGENGRTTKNP